MVFLLIWTLLILPPRLAFDDETNINWFYIDIIVDSLFFVDIYINFTKAYETDNGMLVTDRKAIFMNYLKGIYIKLNSYRIRNIHIHIYIYIFLFLFLKKNTANMKKERKSIYKKCI